MTELIDAIHHVHIEAIGMHRRLTAWFGQDPLGMPPPASTARTLRAARREFIVFRATTAALLSDLRRWGCPAGLESIMELSISSADDVIESMTVAA